MFSVELPELPAWSDVPLDAVAATVLHAMLVALGVAMCVLRGELISTEWLPLVENTSLRSDADQFRIGLALIGGVTLAVVALGIYATWSRTKIPLWSYGATLLVLLTAFLCLAVWSFQVEQTASQWLGRTFPAERDDDELVVARQFNSLYCNAQAAFFCDRATLAELLAAGFGQVILRNHSAVTTAEKCHERFGFNATKTVPTPWLQVCAYCLEAPTYHTHSQSADWSKSHCPFGAATLAWCERRGSLDGKDIAGEFQNAPYVACRGDLLEMADTWSLGAGVIAVITCAMVIALLVLVVRMTRSTADEEALDLDDVEDVCEMYEDASGHERECTPKSRASTTDI
ncbi:hypothetical protein PINS_up022499 [Pythium insidiosum]|nr:hypothetical protein PINS_up022499 [Pythium insidiosum]